MHRSIQRISQTSTEYKINTTERKEIQQNSTHTSYYRTQDMTRAQQLLRSATVPEENGRKTGDCCVPFRGGSWVPI